MYLERAFRFSAELYKDQVHASEVLQSELWRQNKKSWLSLNGGDENCEVCVLVAAVWFSS